MPWAHSKAVIAKIYLPITLTLLSKYPNVSFSNSAYLNSGIVYFSLESWLPICVQEDSLGNVSYAPPSFTNPSLQGYDLVFQAVEFTYNKNGLNTLNINATNVDELGIPLTVSLTDASGTQKVGINKPDSTIIMAFDNCVDTNFNNLVLMKKNNTDVLRIISPEHVMSGMNIPDSTVQYFQSFYDEYIDNSWTHYTKKSVTILVN